MTSLQRIVRYARRKIVGSSIDVLSQRLQRLETELAGYRRLAERLSEDHPSVWLYVNREERMDANDSLFDISRRAFHLERYRFASAYVAGLDVADIASGTGYGSDLLLREGQASSVIGVEIDPRTVAYAKDRYGSAHCRFLAADATQTGIPAHSIDVVVSFETIEHVHDDQALLREFHRILKPKGRLICSTPNDWPIDDSEHHVHQYDLPAFREALSQLFTVSAMFNQNSGGGAHNRGQAAGVIPTTEENASLAECYIAVCVSKHPRE